MTVDGMSILRKRECLLKVTEWCKVSTLLSNRMEIVLVRVSVEFNDSF